MSDFDDPAKTSGFEQEFNDAHFATPKSTPAAKALPWHERLLQGFKDPFNAGAQLATRTVLAPVQAAASAVNKVYSTPLGETIAGLTESIDTSIQKQEQEYQARRRAESMTLGSLVTGQRPEPGIDWLRAGGNISNPINWLGPGGAGFLTNVARGALSSAASVPVTGNQEDFWTQKAKQAGVGATVAGALSPVASAVGRMISPKTTEEVRTLLDSGVPLTPGQILGGWAHRAEDALTSVPVLGDAIRSAQGRGIEGFNKAVYQRALDPVGEQAPQTVGREGVEYVANKLGEKYDALIPNLRFIPDRQFAQEFGTLRKISDALPEAQKKQFDNIVSTQFGKASPNGGIEGETLKGILSTIRQKSKGYGSDASFDNRELGAALNELHNTISRTLQRANPAQAAELKAIDTGWANYARIRQAAASQGAHDGVFTPAQLSGAVKTLDKSVGKGDFAKGKALLQDLSESGKNVLSSKVPDSGTPLRSMLGFLAGGGLTYLGTQHPLMTLGTVAGIGGGALPYTQVGQNVAAKVLASRPEFAPTLAQFAQRGLLGASAPAGSVLLRDFAP